MSKNNNGKNNHLRGDGPQFIHSIVTNLGDQGHKMSQAEKTRVSFRNFNSNDRTLERFYERDRCAT